MASSTRKRSLTGKQVLEAIDALSDSDDFEENDSDRDSNYYPSDDEPSDNPENHSDNDSDAENSTNGKRSRESLAKKDVRARDVSCARTTTALRTLQLHTTSLPSSTKPTDSSSDAWIPVSDSFKPPVVDFTECDGITLPPGVLSAHSLPLDFFTLFLTDNIVSTMVRETNRYAEQYINDTPLKPNSRVQHWKETYPCPVTGSNFCSNSGILLTIQLQNTEID